MPRTKSAARSPEPLRNAPDYRRKVADLLQALATVECNLAVGARPGCPAGLLRDPVILTARLAGRRSLEANPDSAAVFTALYPTRMPPPLAQLRQVLAGLVAGRFGAPPAAAAA